jgi:fucose permease
MLTAVTISGAFVFGVVLVLLGAIRFLLAKQFSLSEGRVDWLLAAFNISLIPMMLLSGLLIDKLGVKNVLIFGSVLTALGVFLLAISGTGLRALGAILMAGAGGAGVSTGSTVLMRSAFFTANEAASQNLGNVFFALGALLTPSLAATLIERLQFRKALSLLALGCLLPACLAALTSRDDFVLPLQQPPDLATVFFHPVLWVTGLMFFLYAPLEAVLSTSAQRYLTAMGIRSRIVTWLLTSFWLAFLSSRLAVALLQERLFPVETSEGWLILFLALAAGVVLGNLVGARTQFLAALGWLLVGACIGPIFPTLVGILFQYFPDERGTSYGAFFAFGAIGNLLLPPVIGIYARRDTPHHALRVPMIMALVIALVAFFLAVARPMLLAR